MTNAMCLGIKAFALSGRLGVMLLSTQGVALGYVIIGLSARAD